MASESSSSSSSKLSTYTYNIPIFFNNKESSSSSGGVKKNAIIPKSQQKPSKSNNNTKKKDKAAVQQCVCFYQKVQVYEHLHRNDLTIPEQNSFWWQYDEYEDTRIECKQTVTIMEKRGLDYLSSYQDNSKVCFRGLEKRTKIGQRDMIRNRKEACDVVNKEITRQYKDILRRKLDMEKLANVYRQKTEHCMKQARQTAIKDEEFVLKEHYGLSMKRIQHTPHSPSSSAKPFWKSPSTPSSNRRSSGVSHHRRTFHGLAA